MNLRLFCSVMTFGTAVSTAAWAEPGTEPAVFYSIDQTGGPSKLSADLSYALMDSNDLFGVPDVDIATQYLHLMGQMTAANGWGGFFQVPIARLTLEDESHTALGMLEIGATRTTTVAENTTIVLRGSLGLPTADSDVFTSVIASTSSRLTDFYLSAHDVVALRLSLSPILSDGRMTFRGDIGIDAGIATEGSNPDPIIRTNAAVAVRTDVAYLSFEFCNIYNPNSDNDASTIQSVGLGARFFAGNVHPGIAVVTPFSIEETDSIFDIVSLQVGIYGALPKM